MLISKLKQTVYKICIHNYSIMFCSLRVSMLHSIYFQSLQCLMYIVFICIDMVVNILLFKPVMKEINRILFVFCTHVTFPLLNVSYLNNYVKVFCVNTFVYIQMVWLFIQVFSPWPPLFHPSQYYHQFDCLWLSKSLKNDVVVDSGIV